MTVSDKTPGTYQCDGVWWGWYNAGGFRPYLGPECHALPPYVWIHLRNAGLNAGGYFRGWRDPKSAMKYLSRALARVSPALDPLPANVYADWLEEHGEGAAAAKLRAAFPLDDGSGRAFS